MPKTLRSGERTMVLKVKEFCEREKRNEAPIIPLRCVQARVAAITGISEKTVSKITKEGQVAASTSTKITTPQDWQKECGHVIKIEEKYFADGTTIDDEVDRFIIEVGDDESDTSDESEACEELSDVEIVHEHNYCKKS
ncbi:hypothetical protein O0L34_g5246 [Tuta absoluta]|nr:hypothetical protein O0L34_g5246 [Tuta absoluta]